MIIEGDYRDAPEFGETVYGEVRVDGKVLTPGASLKVFAHSADGFAWAYYGSGPAQLALAILLEAGIEPTQAIVLHQRFKMEHIATLPRASFRVEVDIPAWVEETSRTVAVPTRSER